METPGQAGGRSDADGAAAPPPEVARELAEIRQQREVQLVRWQLRERCRALAAELEAAQRAVAAREASRGAARAQHEEALAVLQRGYEEKLRATQSSRMLQQLSARMLAQAVAHQIARESVVMLTNGHVGGTAAAPHQLVLPLDAGKLRRVLVVGPTSNDVAVQAHTYHGAAAVASFLAAVLTEIYLRGVCSCQKY